jgi:hypothetical protein
VLLKLKRLWRLASCDHPHADRLAIYSTGAEIHICKLCGRFCTILEGGTALPEQPRYTRPRILTPETVEHYNGKHVSMTDA